MFKTQINLDFEIGILSDKDQKEIYQKALEIAVESSASCPENIKGEDGDCKSENCDECVKTYCLLKAYEFWERKQRIKMQE